MFLYLVPATGPLAYVDLPGIGLAEALKFSPDLARLDWQPTDLTRTWDDVRLALRHGEPVPSGLVVEGLLIKDLRREDELRTLNTDVRTSQEDVAHIDDAFESVAPGWKAKGEELNEEIDEIVGSSARKHRARVEELLGAPPQTHLVDHWQTLGGSLPDPL